MIRASAYPWKMKCPSFGAPIDGPVFEFEEEFTRMGNAIHVLLAQYVETRIAREDISSIAEQFEIDLSELDALYERGLRVADHVLPRMPSPVVEVAIAYGGRQGHPDAYSVSDSEIVVADWKSGFRTDPVSYYDQTACYLWMLRGKYGRRPAYVGIIADVRGGETSTQSMDDHDLDTWQDRANRVDGEALRVYRPGDACRYCTSRFGACAPREQWISAGVNALVEAGPSEATTAVGVAELWPRYEAAKAAVAEFDRVVRAMVADAGSIDLGDGTELGFSVELRDRIDPAKAWPVLQDHGLTGQQISKALSLAKGKLLDVYSSQFGRGLKGKAKAKLTESLRESGAIETMERRTLRRTAKAQGESDD